MEDERHVMLVCPSYAMERLEMFDELELDAEMRDDISVEALKRIIGQGLVLQVELGEKRAVRHRAVKKFLRRVLRKRINDQEEWS